MFLYNRAGSYIEPGGFRLVSTSAYLNKEDANGQEVGPEDFGASSEPYDPFTFEFEADGVAYAIDCVYWRDKNAYWEIRFDDPYEGNPYPSELTFGGEPKSALSVLDVPVENAYVGDTPVVAMYVGKSQVFPVAAWRKFNVDVDKKVIGWVDDKHRIDYIMNNNSEYPVVMKGFATPRFEMTLEPNQSHTAEFWAINEGDIIDVRFEAYTDTGYNFFVYEDEVNVPNKPGVSIYSKEFVWGASNNTDDGSIYLTATSFQLGVNDGKELEAATSMTDDMLVEVIGGKYPQRFYGLRRINKYGYYQFYFETYDGEVEKNQTYRLSAYKAGELP